MEVYIINSVDPFQTHMIISRLREIERERERETTLCHGDTSILENICLVYGVQRHFQQYFSYIVAVSFIGGGNHRPVASN